MYKIIQRIGPFAACIIQTENEDLIFYLDEIESDLSNLNVNGEVLFDRFKTTGDSLGRFSTTSFIRGKFLSRKLKVVKGEKVKFVKALIEPYKKEA